MKTTDLMTAPLADIRVHRIAKAAEIVGLCQASIRQLEHAGKFPKRIAIGSNSSGFLEGDLRRWLAERAASGTLKPTGAVTEPVPAAAVRKAQATRKRTNAAKRAAATKGGK